MGFMLDPRLVGYWSDQYLYQGAMEAADIAFSADGSAQLGRHLAQPRSRPGK